jgi:hypothetical protein
MKSVEVRITGLSALLMHRFPDILEDDGPNPVTVKRKKEEAAELAAYRMPTTDGSKGNLHIPAECMRQTLVNGAAYEKGKGRSTLAKFAAAAIFVSPDCIDLGTSEYEIDTRAVVVPATRGRIPRHRPTLRAWSVTFTIEYDETLLSEAQVRAIIDHAGAKVGVLDYRPQKKGPFGRFRVDEWNPIE